MLIPELAKLPHPQNIMLVSTHDSQTPANYNISYQGQLLATQISRRANVKSESTAQHALLNF